MNTPQKTALPFVVKVQVALAMLATIVTIGLLLYIPGLVKKKTTLGSDIQDLTAQKATIQDKLMDLQKQTDEIKKQKADAERLGSALASAYYATNPAQVQKTLNESVSSNAETAALPRVFIHIRSESQRSAAQKVTSTLRQQGYQVPGIQILVKTGPDKTQVRYFHSEEEVEAQKVLDLLAASGVTNAAKTPTLIPGYPDIRRRQYEIWFAPDSI